ncbi:hypothetical protein [Lysobacter hankyongensis]|uniref:PD(D/E)XK endonuclease domain-containing protein n=1 Tax=Lysobacter hankyongensis TaxID=1176535 RepID=A0ABP9AIB2_9GAMM
MSKHQTEQAARGYLMYRLALLGYTVQFTDSRFPKEDLLVVSPGGKHFGIDVKGQSTANFWQYSEKPVSPELFLAFVYIPSDKHPRCFIVPSDDAMRLWRAHKHRAEGRGASHQRWGINWTTPHAYEDKFDLLPK